MLISNIMVNLMINDGFFYGISHEPMCFPCPQFHEIMIGFLMQYKYVELYVC